MYAYMCACMYVCMYVRVHVRTCACMYVCLKELIVSMYVFKYRYSFNVRGFLLNQGSCV